MSKFVRKTPPEGWEIISDVLEELDFKLRDGTLLINNFIAENEPHEGKRKQETVWPIFRIHHQKSRYVFDQFRSGKISRELYDYCIREKVIDAGLISKWKKPGYEKLCCLRCIEKKDHGFNTTCKCRVPSANLDDNVIIQCVHCGCRGCASGENGKKKKKRAREVDEDSLPPALRNKTNEV